VIVRPLFRSLSRPLFTALSGAASAITKVLIDLSPTSNGFYSLGTPQVFAGDFKVKGKFATTSTNQQDIVGDSTSTNLRLIINGNRLQMLVGNGSGLVVNFLGSTLINDGLLHSFEFSKIGDDYKIVLDGSLEASNTNTAAVSPIVTHIGQRGTGASFFKGIIADVELIDITTPANSLEFKLDQLTANTETNNGVTLTYQNIGTGTSVRDTYVLSNDGTQYISDLRTIDIAAQA
jgi:hypothetical protein